MGNRIHLVVQSVKPIREGTSNKGAYKALDFKAFIQGDPNQKSESYGIFNKPELFALILVDAVIDADVIDKPSGKFNESGQEYINHNITNIYVDGKPVMEQKQFGGSRDSDTPEKRRSIERQTSITIAAQMLGATLSLDALLKQAEQIYQWIANGTIPSPKPVTTPQGAKAPQQVNPTSDTKPSNLPASQKEVFDKLMALVKSGALSQVDATRAVVDLGGTGENILHKIKSLNPEKLQELAQKLDGIKPAEDKELFE